MAWTSHPYDAEGYVYLLAPTVVLKARVNLVDAAYPLAAIPFDGATVGSIDDVEMGMTVLVGSVDGAWDRGHTYVRGDDDQGVGGLASLNIGYTERGRVAGHVDLVDNSYITVLDSFEPWKRPSRYLEGSGILKDYELDTTGRSLPVAHIGNTGGLAAMGFTASGVLALDFDSSTSHVTAPGAALAATAWDVKDGAITVGSDTSAAITVEFPAGKRWIKLLKTQTDAEVSLPRRMLVVALDDGDDTVLTAHKARLKLVPEGATFSCDVRQRLDPGDYPPGTVAIWLVKERYAGVAGSMTGWEVKFAGYVDSMRSSGKANRTDFERATTISASDVAGRAAALRALPSTVARGASPANPNEMAGANLDRYAWWLLSWHTSLPMLTDFHWSGEDHPFTSFSSPGGNFYGAGDGVARAGAKRLTMDSRGRLLIVEDTLRLEMDDRTTTVLQSIGPADILSIDRVTNPFPAVGVMRATATLESSIDASTYDDDHEPPPDIHAVAPGLVEGQGVGEQQNSVPWLVPTALAFYQRIGQDYERANADEAALKITLAHGGDGGIEPALLAWVEVTTDDDTLGWWDTPLDHERCLVLSVEYSFDDAANTQTQVITVLRETTGTPGVYDPIAGDDTRLPDYNPLPPYTPGVDVLPTELIIFDSGHAACHIARAWSPALGTLIYEDVSSGLEGGGSYVQWADPWNYGKYYCAQNALVSGDGSNGLYRNPAPFSGGSWVKVLDFNDFALDAACVWSGGGSINRKGYQYVVLGTHFIYTTDSWATVHDVDILGGGGGYASPYASIAQSNYNNGSEGWVYAYISTGEIYKSLDWGATWTSVRSGAIGGVHVPYIRTDGVTPNTNDAAQELYYGEVFGYGLLSLSKDGGLTTFQSGDTGVGGYHPIPASDYTISTFTYDGNKVASAMIGNSSGRGTAPIVWSDFLASGVVASPPIIVGDINIGYNGRVKGFSTHSGAHLFYNLSRVEIFWSDDDGATWSTSAVAPVGYSGVGGVEWTLRNVIEPPIGGDA